MRPKKNIFAITGSASENSANPTANAVTRVKVAMDFIVRWASTVFVLALFIRCELPAQHSSPVAAVHVVDRERLSPVPFVSVLIGEEKVSYGSEFGLVYLDKSLMDSVRISCVGYAKAVLAAKDLSSGDTILLRPEAIALSEVTVNASRRAKTTSVGFFRKPASVYGVAMPGYEYGVLILNTIGRGVWLDKVSIKIRRYDDYRSALRLHLYENAGGKPGKEVPISNTISISESSREKSLSFDVSAEAIRFPPEGLFVAVEWIGKVDSAGRVMFDSLPVEPMIGFTKSANTALTWERSKGGEWEPYKIGAYVPRLAGTVLNAAFGVTVIE